MGQGAMAAAEPAMPAEPASALAWHGFAGEGWWPAQPLDWGAWLPTWPELGAAASSLLHPVGNAWVLLLACVPALALLIDRVLGEPGVRWHPVVWMGNYLGAMGRRIAPPSQPGGGPGPAAPSDRMQFALGALAWCGGAAGVVVLAALLQALALHLPIAGAVLALALLLKPMLAWAMLHDEVLAVEVALGQSLQAGREQLSRLVSRDTGSLDEATVRESAIETLAENLCDSLVAPLFWFALLGLPGAALYRFANTADALWGYPGARAGRHWAWAGKWAARADDVLSWVPARLTALLLMLGAPLAQWRALPADAAQTPSPNGGWTMGAMALRLGVRLRKPGAYALNARAGAPGPVHSLQAARLAGRACWLSVALACGGILLQLHGGGAG
jgi:adenosylcobinamide-phosphate synthase